MNPLNLYSVPLLILSALILAGILLLRRGISRERLTIIAALGLGLLVVWYFLRPVQTPHAELEDFQRQIGAGTPVLLEFQSPY
ncbi:MAG: hypothetical protein JSV61_16485 [Anaerolineales bacterium]|nr:MAG: hypothetical protein JSV61_16485 [Anaerolineales bacterium]